MRLPLPRNKLVAFSLVGGILAVAASVALASPAVMDAGARLQDAAASSSDLPPPDAPGMAFSGEDDDDGWEHEDEDEHEYEHEDEDYEDDEHAF